MQTNTLDNPVRGRLNAAVLRGADGYAHWLLGPRKRELFADLPSTVVEIGPGTGANLRYYRPGTHLIAVEPNRRMHQTLRDRARRHGIDLELRAEGAQAMGLPDASVDAVVSTLVLCTVPDPAAVLAEVRRVLRPDGTFFFLEHVRAGADQPMVRGAQSVLATPWRWFFEGCDVRRDLGRDLADAGWTRLERQLGQMRSIFLPINSLLSGMAVR
jgi:SAM-dependent methyltransferase